KSKLRIHTKADHLCKRENPPSNKEGGLRASANHPTMLGLTLSSTFGRNWHLIPDERRINLCPDVQTLPKFCQIVQRQPKLLTDCVGRQVSEIGVSGRPVLTFACPHTLFKL